MPARELEPKVQQQLSRKTPLDSQIKQHTNSETRPSYNHDAAQAQDFRMHADLTAQLFFDEPGQDNGNSAGDEGRAVGQAARLPIVIGGTAPVHRVHRVHRVEAAPAGLVVHAGQDESSREFTGGSFYKAPAAVGQMQNQGPNESHRGHQFWKDFANPANSF